MDLSVDSLAVSLGGRRVLEGVSATLRPGRVTAILGPNGSGKTTLVRTLAGLIDPDAGHVRLGDRPITRIEPRERARLIGYLPQDGAVYWNLGARELVGLGRLPHRAPFAAPSPEDAGAVEVALAATDTESLADRRANELSGGERARVLLARVLAGTPRWLLADEPLASLDPAHQLDMLAQLRSQAAAGVGVVIVLHDLIQAARAADDVLLLSSGRAVAFGAAAQTLSEAHLRAVFDIDVLLAADRDGRPLPIPLGRRGT
jgi:iron complex transport system ATP-binding protein